MAPRNGSGGYSPPQNSWNPAINNMQALPNDWMAILNDVSATLQASIAADGQTPITGSLNFGNNRLRNVGAPQGSGDGLRFEQMMKGDDVASAATIAFPIEGSLFDVTGTATITAIAGAFAGRMVLVRFKGALTLTNGANFALPGGASITTQAGDFAVFVCLDGTAWQCWLYPRVQSDIPMRAASSDHYGPTAPASPWVGMMWADSSTGTIKRRNAANNDWVVEGELFERPLYSEDSVLQWLGVPIGSPIPIVGDAPKPPTNDPRFRYIILSAGQTGTGGYNNGMLGSETVTGTAPLINAVANVTLSTSPLYQKAVRLINTERRFIGADLSEGPETDFIQDHQHPISAVFNATSVAVGPGAALNLIVQTRNTSPVYTGGSARVSDHTQPYTYRISHYMRIL